MNTFPKFSSRYSRRTDSSPLNMSYMGLNSGSALSLSCILWSYGRCGGSLSAAFFENTSRNSWNSLGSFSRGSIVTLGARTFSMSCKVTAKIAYSPGAFLALPASHPKGPLQSCECPVLGWPFPRNSLYFNTSLDSTSLVAII
jgi:hypothetical protein